MTRTLSVALLCTLMLPPLAQAERLLVQPDQSGSMRNDLYEAYVDTLIQILRANAHRISGVEIMPFASATNGSWNAPRNVFDWGIPPSEVPFDPLSVRKTLAGQLFRRAGDQETATALDAHRRAMETAKTTYWQHVDEHLTAIRTRLLVRPVEQARCTSFVDLALRSARNRQPQLVITDGVGTCEDPRVAIPKTTATVALGPLPSRTDRAGSAEARAFLARQAALKELFPSAAITTGDDLGVIETLLTTAAEGSNPAQPTPAPVAAPSGFRKSFRPVGTLPPSQPTVVAAEQRQEPARAGQAQASDGTPVTERLTVLIQKLQRQHVRESFGLYEGQLFTDRDLAAFMATDVPEQAASSVRTDARVARIVADLRALPAQRRAVVLNGARKPLHQSWTALGRISPQGQSDAGVRAELLIANAVIDMLEAELDEKRL